MPIKTNYLQNRVEISEDVYEEILAEKKKTFRDILWDYPTILANFFLSFQPISSIIIFSIIAFFAISNYKSINSFLSNNILAEIDASAQTTITEGTIGSISNLNPIFITNSQADKDIQALVFQKFLTLDENGSPRPLIAERWRVVGDQEYTFYLKDNLYFSDGQKLTAEDVKYTFDTAIYLSKNNGLNTVGNALENVTISIIDDYTIKFSLSEKNATIYEAVSQYIVPKHYFELSDINLLENSWLNNKPIGSGPYVIAENTDYSIKLVKSDYYKPSPNIEVYYVKFFNNYDDLLTSYYNNKLDIVSNLEANALDFEKANVSFKEKSILINNRKKIIYFNTRDKFKNIYLRQALSHLVEKEALISSIGITALPIQGPISESSWAYNNDKTIYYEYSPEKASSYLASSGYKRDEATGIYINSNGEQLSFSLTYLDTDLNKKIAKELKNQFEENGVILDIESDIKDYDQMIREILPTRDFELLLYELETTIDPDQYNLWHSLKSDYPNLNISGKTEKSQRIDLLLEMARMTTKINGEKGRKEYYQNFQKYFMSDAPAIFLYSPNYSYFISKKLVIPEQEFSAVPADRFQNVAYWEIKN